MKINKDSTDQEIKDFMLTAKSVKEWNEMREAVKPFRDEVWVAINLDGSGLIMKCNFE